MSDAGASIDTDDVRATMTRDANASRTFRSIFSGAMQHESGDELDGAGELKLHSFQRTSSSTFSDSTGYRHNDDMDDMDDDDDGVWSDDDDSASPRPNKDLLRAFSDSNNNYTATEQRAATDSEQDAFAAVSSSSDEAGAAGAAPRVIPHRRSMEEWADDDDEEDAWKDMLQAKVNQLELVIQSNNDAQPTDARIALSPTTGAPRFGAVRAAPTDRPLSRNKLQRTSGTASDGSLPPSQLRQPVGGLHLPPAPAGISSPSNYLRKRTGSRDFTPSLVSKLCGDAKRTAKKPANTKSLPRSASTSAITRSSARTAARKNSFDATHGGGSARPKPSSTVASAAALPPAAQRAISDAEAVRRFLLHDIKQMSMDRLVADAKRLQFLEAFYKQQQSSADASSSRGAAT